MERAEQLRLRLRAGEEAAAVAAAAAKADAGEEEAVASLHGSGGMGCSLRVLLAHTELCPGPPAGPRRLDLASSCLIQLMVLIRLYLFTNYSPIT